MSKMVERAARAAYTKWIEGVESVESPWEQMPQDFRDRMVDAQRAAINAMREPTERMCVAGELTEFDCHSSVTWKAMIDETLK